MPEFAYCTDEKYQYIVNTETKKVIYKKDYLKLGKSDFCFVGRTDKGPVFYDTKYSTYLYPDTDGYKIYTELYNAPITINGINAANITEGDSGVGVIDSYANVIVKNEYSKITIELKITAENNEKKEIKIIPFPNNVFEKGG